MLMALRFLANPERLSQAVIIGIVGGIALLFSQPAVLVACGLGVILLVEEWRARGPTGKVAALGAGWATGAAIVTYVSVITLSASTSDYMERFWRTSFPPPPWLGISELLWLPRRLAETIIHLVAHINTPQSLPALALVAMYTLLLVLGIFHLFKRSSRSALVLAAPVIVAIIAAIVRVLPLSGRVSLFIGPSLLIGSFAGFDRIRSWLPARTGSLAHACTLGFAILPALALLARDPPPWINSWTRSAMEDVRANWEPGDRLAVSRGEWTLISVEYYGRRLGIMEWTHIPRLKGSHTAEQILRGYLSALDAFRGNSRAWLYLEGTVPCEDEAMVGYLMAIGKRLHSARFDVNEANRVSAHLFDLSDPAMLARTSAETYPVPECRG